VDVYGVYSGSHRIPLSDAPHNAALGPSITTQLPTHSSQSPTRSTFMIAAVENLNLISPTFLPLSPHFCCTQLRSDKLSQDGELQSIVTFSWYPPSVTPPTSFDNYCSQVEPWEHLLSSNLNLLFPLHKLITCLELLSFKACSGGSTESRQGTFGWALATSNTTRLAHVSGPVKGHDPQLLCSKA
jgi:hypothetical protein